MSLHFWQLFHDLESILQASPALHSKRCSRPLSTDLRKKARHELQERPPYALRSGLS